jgi:glycosyltransferase 2 family protein
MQGSWRRALPLVKLLVGAVIIAAVGWQFAKVLRRPELWSKPFRLHPGWLALSALLYAAGFCCWGGVWLRLLRRLGERISLAAAARAYFVSQTGKYVPGKAWAIVLRVAMAREVGVRGGVAALTATYETLATMAAGALVAAVLLPWRVADGNLGWQAVGLLAVAGLPILPGIFNRLTRRLAKPFLDPAQPLPEVRAPMLLGGLLQSAVGWWLLGASLLALLRALRPDGAANPDWVGATAFVALAYVAGFLALPAPGGLGVREVILARLLSSEWASAAGEEAEAVAVVAVLTLRLVWTATEALLAAGSEVLFRMRKNGRDQQDLQDNKNPIAVPDPVDPVNPVHSRVVE